MKIGLIDVDGHNYPNIALMKISAYHKAKGDSAEWWFGDFVHYDIVYMSKVFSNEYSPDIPEPINADKVIKGGTGYAIHLENGIEVFDKSKNNALPYEMEHIYPDYSLYPEYTKDTAYGFLTRGCPYGEIHKYCHVGKKEGCAALKVADLSEFWHGQKNIVLCDPNILACKDWRELFQQLIDSKAKIDFNQGLDAKLLTQEKAEMLAQMKLDLPHFAMDTMKDIEFVKSGLKLYADAYKKYHNEKWNWRNAKVFCLTNFDTTHEQDMERIKAIQECECWPYVMIYNKPSAPKITKHLQRYTNNAILYSKVNSFDEYMETIKNRKRK